MANAFHYSIGRKFIQAVSGAFLIIFLGLHVTINFFSVIDSFTGRFGDPDGLFALGCDFMSLPIVTIMVPVLALGFIVKRYEAGRKGAADSWASQNMFVLGIIILGILFIHLTHFWANMQLQDFMGAERVDPYLLLVNYFGRWWILLLYIIWFVAIWFHLTHGFWSMFHTVGWDNGVWFKRLKVIGIVVATLIVLAFIIVALNGFFQAQALM